MPFTVKIQFDGLFVFVHRPMLATPTLVVLAANTREHHPSHGQHAKHPVHEGWVQVGSNTRVPFTGDVDLSSIGLKGGTSRIPNALPLSSKTGEHVEEKFLTGDFSKVDKKLHGRVALPMPKSVRPITSVAVAWKNPQGVWEPLAERMSGHVELEYDANAPLSIAGSAIKNDTTVVFTHLPPGSTIEWHPAGVELEHSHMHSPIFKDKAPTFRTTEEFNPPPAMAEKMMAAFGGDPVVCTSGNGCPPEDLNCGGG